MVQNQSQLSILVMAFDSRGKGLSNFYLNCSFICRDGRNIACTLALREGQITDPSSTWSAESTFFNLIEATKRIGGLSFGDILKHPRCAGSKEHFSKTAVNQVKEALQVDHPFLSFLSFFFFFVMTNI